ncbi:MAG: 23S rRNA (pseudouridine(1915)-N(3))-methyltransferase RlmH [Bacteroidaceae bacterium]|nr:23S rRNA (pseudouridine(1915)-N(3))-methyltransferase RlmH [Bacteroidaceae bacterium]
MKFLLLVIGKTTSPALVRLIDDYVERIGHFLPFSIEELPELRNTKSLSQQQQKALEGKALLAKLKADDHIVLLDEHGRQFSSTGFADYIKKKQQLGGTGRIVFIIGGPYGFAPEVYERANDQLSLSQMTFSHQMIRLLFVEQLYRALTILNHLPYHHE